MVKSKKEDFLKYMGSVLQNSMVTGIPQIAMAGNIPKRLIRTIVFVMCIIGFIYQSIDFMKLYFEYGVVMDIMVENPPVAALPAVTLCNTNGIQVSKVCGDPEYASECERPTGEREQQFCYCRPRYCQNGTLPDGVKFPSRKVMRLLSLGAQHEYQRFLQENQSFFTQVQEMRFKQGELRVFPDFAEKLVSVRSPNSFGSTSVCFTLNTIIGQSEEKIREVNPFGFMLIAVEVSSEENDPEAEEPTVQMAVHNPRTVANPYVEGRVLYMGTDYIINLKKAVTVRLPPPYETRCVDYYKLWEENGGFGPTTERECVQECQKNASLEVSGCVMKSINIPFNERTCADANHGDAEKVTKISNECIHRRCGPACVEEQYEMSITKDNKLVEPGCEIEKVKWRKENEIVLFLQFNGMETTTYTFKPRFQNIETFSYLGGYVGMWLGISLVAVFDFIETMVVMMKYPLRRMCAAQVGRRPTKVRKIDRNEFKM